ncbi:hypothetical protein ACMZ4Y_00370 [Prevotella histicola]
MKRFLASTFAFLLSLCSMAQGWPGHDHSVMLQGFYWDSFQETQWTNLEKMADDFADYFNLVWVPQSGKGGLSRLWVTILCIISISIRLSVREMN